MLDTTPMDMPDMDQEARWAAVLAREKAADGQFVFAVSTTGIYCRPSCPSRRPHRENVSFFDGPDAAEHAGFRPCLRCRPDAADISEGLVDRVRRAIEAAEVPPTLSELSALTGQSPWHLQRTFKAETGLTPRQYAAMRRRERLKDGLRGGRPVMDASFEAGYNTGSRAYEDAGKHLGMTPATYGRGGKGAQIAYDLADSPVGRMLVAGTDRGMCFLAFGASDDDLQASLRAEYPEATIRKDAAPVAAWRDAALAYLEGREPALDLPLDIPATDFRRRVWEALCAIPAGQTRTYKEIAEALGAPGAVRAVGSACGANPVSLAIPCHRAIGSDGRMHGYRWGLERKQWLLERERRE